MNEITRLKIVRNWRRFLRVCWRSSKWSSQREVKLRNRLVDCSQHCFTVCKSLLQYCLLPNPAPKFIEIACNERMNNELFVIGCSEFFALLFCFFARSWRERKLSSKQKTDFTPTQCEGRQSKFNEKLFRESLTTSSTGDSQSSRCSPLLCWNFWRARDYGS
jgi:hypothetical protein